MPEKCLTISADKPVVILYNLMHNWGYNKQQAVKKRILIQICLSNWFYIGYMVFDLVNVVKRIENSFY